MNYIEFEVKTTRYTTYQGNPDDQYDRDSTDADVTILSASLVDDDKFNVLGTDEECNIGDKIYLVWATYSTGDSFGSDGGQYELLSVTKDKQTAEEKEAYYGNIDDFSVPWIGYFESLEGIHITEMILC
jgi:hypothetical protein